jgi:hypothetical protein
LRWHDKVERNLTKMASLGTPQMQHNGVTLIPTPARVKGKVQLAHTAWKILAQYV